VTKSDSTVVNQIDPSPARHAVIWDFDGTLVDSREKNLSVTREIIATITSRSADSFEALASVASYKAATTRARNWRDLYASEFGFAEADIDQAGALWTEYQHRDATATPIIDGIHDTLRALNHLPHGIVSQNARAIISSVLDASELGDHFHAIIGYEEVSMSAQKPAPDGLLHCIERLTAFRLGCVFYIGDHEGDTLCAAHAKEEVATRGLPVEVVAIAALFEGETTASWSVVPDHEARRPQDIIDLVQRYVEGG
jgi:HAD superfamily hydrolase (TIGR01549 family)